MDTLKLSELLLVGNIKDKHYFENYFESVQLVSHNSKVLNLYQNNPFSIIFLYAESKEGDLYSVCQQIRENDKKKIIVVISDEMEISIDRLQRILPLQLSGYIKKPFDNLQVEEVFYNIRKNLKFLLLNKLRLKDGYSFDLKKKVLLDNYQKEVILTKKEVKLLDIFISSPNTFLLTTDLEQQLWENESLISDCNKRFRNLLVTLRKKLPKDTIVNTYGMGYKFICY